MSKPLTFIDLALECHNQFVTEPAIVIVHNAKFSIKQITEQTKEDPESSDMKLIYILFLV